MKKIVKIIMVAIMVITMTGCVKFNANMDIKKDKSMDFNIIYALDTTYFGEETVFDAEDQKELKEKGFEVEEYQEGNYKGFKLSRKIINIDLVSSTANAKYSLSGILSGEDEETKQDDYIFKVEKGLLKNKYTAKLDFDSSDSELSDTEDETDDYTNTNEYAFDYDIEEEPTTDEYDGFTDEDMSALEDITMSGINSMDLSFNVTLPYPAISNNATTATNDNKTLQWKLSSEETTSIEFEFELYNMTTIYLIIAAAIMAVVAIIILLVVISKKNKSNDKPAVAPTTQVNENAQVAPTTQIVQSDQMVTQQTVPVTSVQPTMTEQVVQPTLDPTTTPVQTTQQPVDQNIQQQ